MIKVAVVKKIPNWSMVVPKKVMYECLNDR
jgi:hypothetical protein